MPRRRARQPAHKSNATTTALPSRRSQTQQREPEPAKAALADLGASEAALPEPVEAPAAKPAPKPAGRAKSKPRHESLPNGSAGGTV